MLCYLFGKIYFEDKDDYSGHQLTAAWLDYKLESRRKGDLSLLPAHRALRGWDTRAPGSSRLPEAFEAWAALCTGLPREQ
eukprot:7267730-Pyramimonas_sp.AAC.1